MPVKSKWLGGQVIESANDSVHYFRDAGQRFFPESLPAARVLNTDPFNVRSKERHPRGKNGWRTSGMGETEEPHGGVWPGSANKKVWAGNHQVPHFRTKPDEAE
jgi:hypothetical protein